MLTKIKYNIGPLALLLLSLVYFFDSSGIFAALFPAVLIHEAGHLLLLRMGKMPLRRISLTLAGLEIDYLGELRGAYGAATILAGPFFGFAYALAASTAGGEYLSLSAGLSLGLSIFNLLPILPLDGGRLLYIIFPRKGRGLSKSFALCLLPLCFSLSLHASTPAPLLMSIWLVYINLK